MTTDKQSGGWSRIRQQLKAWSKPALVALIKDLPAAASSNRDFLLARCQAEPGDGAAVANYRCKIVEQFFPQHGFGKLTLAEARKAIRDSRKPTGNLAGTIDLMLTYVESGTQFTREYGDIDEPCYNSLDSVLVELAQLLLNAGAEFYPWFQDRLLQVEADASHIGWGYCDSVREQVQLLETTLAVEAADGGGPAPANKEL